LFAQNELYSFAVTPQRIFRRINTVLTVIVQKLEDAVVLRCQGRIRRGDETAILCKAVQHQGQDVSLDLSRVDTIDGAGMGALVSLQAAGIYLRLMNPTEQVRELLRITKLNSVFEICESKRPTLPWKEGQQGTDPQLC
jgi:anti-anti-sigma factor